MQEQWKAVVGYEGLYEVSNTGRVRSLTRRVKHAKDGYSTIQGREMAQSKGRSGHSNVHLTGEDKKRKTFGVHVLVAKAFIPNPNNYPQVLHSTSVTDGGDNSADNLRWGTHEMNMFDITKEVKTNREKIQELEQEVLQLKKRIAELEAR